MSTGIRCLIAFSLLAGGVALILRGVYGLTIFIVFPIVLGALTTWVFRPVTAVRALALGSLAITLALSSLLLLGLEGWVCLLMALPLAIPLAAIGSVFAFLVQDSRAGAILLVLPPASLTWDITARPVIFEVRSAIEIAAPPERVWQHVVTFSDLPEPHEWYFRVGLAYPQRARIVGSGVGAVRYCEFSTGPFVEPIEVWDEPRLLQFRVTQNPAPMHEWSPYTEVLPKHLHGYLISKKGQFRLTRLKDNRTLLEGRTWYQHGLWPGEYWRWWSDAIIHRIHLRVLEHIRTLAEGAMRLPGARGPVPVG